MNRFTLLLRDHLGFSLVALFALAGASGLFLLLDVPPAGTEPGILWLWMTGLHRWSSRLVLAGAVIHALLRVRVPGLVRADAHALGATLFGLLLLEHLGGVGRAFEDASRLATTLAAPALHYALLPLAAAGFAVVHLARAQGGRWSREYAPRPVAAINLAVAVGVFSLLLAFLPKDGSTWPDGALDLLEARGTPVASFGVVLVCAALLGAHPWLATRPGMDRLARLAVVVFLATAGTV